MKKQNRGMLWLVMGVSALSGGCGGGGGSSGSATGAATLSADQSAFEQFTLTPNAAYDVTGSLPYSGTPVSGSNYLVESHASVAASPSTSGAQALNGSAATSLAHTLGVPATFAVERYLINGAIVAGSGGLNTVSYQGTGIEDNLLAADGSTVVESTLRSNLTIVPLSGTVATAPAELQQWFNALYYNPALLGTTAAWTTGAAYLKYTATELADSYRVDDYTGATTGTTPNPVATGTTIAALMTAGGIASPQDGITYTLASGSVTTVNGVTTFVAATTQPDLTTPAYRTFYDLNGNVYEGDLVKAGTVIGGNPYPVAASGSPGYTLDYSQQIQIRLNAAAVASLSAAVTF